MVRLQWCCENITISNLPADFTTNGYTLTIYGDAATTRTMNYTIGSTTQTINDTGIFTGTFSGENSTTFTGLTAGSFSITGNASGARSAVNGIVITSLPPVPEPATGLLALLGLGFLTLRRR